MQIKLKNPKIYKYLVEKQEHVDIGRKISQEIEEVEKEINVCIDKEKEITIKVEPKELIVKGNAIDKEIGDLLKKQQKIVDEITAQKMAAIPKSLMDMHKGLLKRKEELERERNKKALFVQKIKDKVIPLIQKEVKPKLGPYEDIDTAVIKNGVVCVEVYDQLEIWKKGFKRK